MQRKNYIPSESQHNLRINSTFERLFNKSSQWFIVFLLQKSLATGFVLTTPLVKLMRKFYIILTLRTSVKSYWCTYFSHKTIYVLVQSIEGFILWLPYILFIQLHYISLCASCPAFRICQNQFLLNSLRQFKPDLRRPIICDYIMKWKSE